MSDDYKGAAHVVRLSDVKVERVSWLWQDRIPLRKLTVIEGHPGTGKSTFTMELAACVTTGTALPGGPQLPPADVLVLTAEDGLADTVRPRLEAAKGDARLVKDGRLANHGRPGAPKVRRGDLPRKPAKSGRLARAAGGPTMEALTREAIASTRRSA